MNSYYALVLLPLVPAAMAFGLTPLVSRFAIRIGAVDHPGDRKVHSKPMPRLGGLAVIVPVAVMLVAARLVGGQDWVLPRGLELGLLLGLLPIVGVSLLDDISPVRARVKLLCHVLGATLAVMAGITLPGHIHVLGYEFSIGFLAAPISVVWLIGVTNAFNIIDGLDGLAAGLGFISALAVSAVLITCGLMSSAILPLALAGAIAGFLPHNLYPARIFLGDTGATAIGFALAAVALNGGSTLSVGFATATPLLIMGLPIADTLVAIARRLVRRAEHRVGVFEPDRDHVHHRLLALGLNHRTAVWVLFSLAVLMASVAYLSLFISSRQSALLLMVLIIAGALGLKHLRYDEFAWLRRGTMLRLYEAPVIRSPVFLVFVDIASICLGAYLAVALKTDDWLFQSESALVVRMVLFLVPLSMAVFWKARLYGRSWRSADVTEYLRASAVCGTVVFLALVLGAWQFQIFPASLLIVDGLLSTVLIVGSRASYRMLASAQRAPALAADIPTLLYIPGPADVVQARNILDRAASFGLRPVGFVTSTETGRGQLLAGLQVLGSVDELPLHTRSSGAQVVVLARQHASEAVVRRFEQACRVSRVVLYLLNTEFEVVWGDDIGDLTPKPFFGYVPRAAPRHRELIQLE